jgi:hypothetical protein
MFPGWGDAVQTINLIKISKRKKPNKISSLKTKTSKKLPP